MSATKYVDYNGLLYTWSKIKALLSEKADIVSENTSSGWANKPGYVPKKGELCLYVDSSTLKIGDGSTQIADLPFIKDCRIPALTNEENTFLRDDGTWADPLEGLDFLKVKSCTPNSNKYFKLYIDDEGSLIVRKGDNWFDVDYYDGEELLHTEEIWTSGQNATWNETPAAKEDEYFTYTFLGWATDDSPETVNANAQNNITSDRNLHAVWEKTGKTVTADFYSMSPPMLIKIKTIEVTNGTSLYDIIANESWDSDISSVYDVTNSDDDAIVVYNGDSSTSILTTEAGRTALMDTQVMGNTKYGLVFVEEPDDDPVM